MKVHNLSKKKEYKELEKQLESREFEIVNSLNNINADSLVIIDSKASAEKFKEKNVRVLGCFIIIPKEKEYEDIKGLADKYFVYSLVEDEKHHEFANSLDTELLVHSEFSELIEEVLIDIISVQHS